MHPVVRTMGLTLACCTPNRHTDLATGSPSLGLDALYGVLGLVLGFNAWNERQLLASRQHKGDTGDQK